MKEHKQFTESAENYLKVILQLSETSGITRVRDISKAMRVKAPSAANAVKTLMDGGLVKHETYGYVELTLAGQKIAEDVAKREKILFHFLNEILRVDEASARRDACRMEHSLSNQAMEKLIKFIEFMERGSSGGIRKCMSGLREYYRNGKMRECRKCDNKKSKD